MSNWNTKLAFFRTVLIFFGVILQNERKNYEFFLLEKFDTSFFVVKHKIACDATIPSNWIFDIPNAYRRTHMNVS